MKPKLFFDEGFGKPVIGALASILAFRHEPLLITHIIDFCGTHGVKDEDWVPMLKDESWTVFSLDLGKGGKGEKLPRLCVENGITHILLSPALHKSSQFEKIRCVLAAWPQIIDVAESNERGGRYMLQRGTHSAHLAAKEIRE